MLSKIPYYRNPSFGFTTKARVCEGANQKGSSGVTFYVPESVGECEGMNLHIPKWAPTLGVEVPMDSRILENDRRGQNPFD